MGAETFEGMGYVSLASVVFLPMPSSIYVCNVSSVFASVCALVLCATNDSVDSVFVGCCASVSFILFVSGFGQTNVCTFAQICECKTLGQLSSGSMRLCKYTFTYKWVSFFGRWGVCTNRTYLCSIIIKIIPSRWKSEVEEKERDINKTEWELYEVRGLPGGQ